MMPRLAAMPVARCLSWIILFVGGSVALELETCRNALGMESMQIPDSALIASSMANEDVGPTSARIRMEIGGGAWCPKRPISKDVHEYLQVDLGELKVITLVETQGRFGEGQGQEYTDQYLLEYQREAGEPWFRFKNRREQEIIEGNINTYIGEVRIIDPPIIARKIRFIPYSVHPKQVCMRVELHGCPWTDSIVSYDMRQGERRGSEVDLYDFTYDGTQTSGMLAGGLGQLTDGAEGQDSFRLDPGGLGIKGYQWVGWKNETFRSNPIELTFKFDQPRNFTSIRIHANNMFSKDVRVFKKAKVFFSIGGEHYLGEPLDFHYMRDTTIEFARSVFIPVPHRVGRFVKLELFFDAKWLMLSEVGFESTPAVGVFPPEVVHQSTPSSTALPNPPRRGHKNPTGLPDFVQVIDLPAETTAFNRSLPKNGRRKGKDRNDGEEGRDASQVAADQADNSADLVRQPPFQSPSATSTESSVVDAKTRQSLDDEYIGIIIGVLAALILILFAVILAIILRHRRRKYNNNHRAMKSIEPRHVTLNLNDLNALNGGVGGKVLSNGNMYNCVATSEEGESDRDGACCYDHLRSHYLTPGDLRLGTVPSTPSLSDTTTTSRDYAVPSDLTKTLLRNHSATLGPFPSTSTLPRPPPPINPAYQGSLFRPKPTAPSAQMPQPMPYATTDVVAPGLQGVSGNNIYAVSNTLDLLWKDDLTVMEIPRDSLKPIEKLGEGQFGEVHLCEVVPELLTIEDMGPNSQGARPALVAAKMLRSNASEQARTDFHKEVKIMSRLKDPNIVQVLGVMTQEEPLSVVVEYMEGGDLHQFLRQRSLDCGNGTMTRSRKNAKLISHGCLVYVATQIASGMKYLEGLNMVHRDLATRNCLVGHNYAIKIADFGMSRSLYSTDYYKIEGNTVLPIRWMAWESLLLGKFSTKSDVWSFGVTLWEVLTLAKEHPYEGLSDDQVIANCNQCYLGNGLDIVLPQPATCPREIYDLMVECWNRDEVARPSFREIHMFLQRKNMGFLPTLRVNQAAV